MCIYCKANNIGIRHISSVMTSIKTYSFLLCKRYNSAGCEACVLGIYVETSLCPYFNAMQTLVQTFSWITKPKAFVSVSLKQKPWWATTSQRPWPSLTVTRNADVQNKNRFLSGEFKFKCKFNSRWTMKLDSEQFHLNRSYKIALIIISSQMQMRMNVISMAFKLVHTFIRLSHSVDKYICIKHSLLSVLKY